jgi:hypothetical protein
VVTPVKGSLRGGGAENDELSGDHVGVDGDASKSKGKANVSIFLILCACWSMGS